ncbi:thiamine-phosphate kinase [Vibrio vulnificus]|nr:thiamine-phosphate kinase [Vibrio vulnificus]EGR0637835.1 thiamine-phosphate kinase [Vibrio vulnificus]EHK9117924.1 thiamine-phosphate kinase [Vibrio vulnificus]EHK9119152.1 thiamine-phosphate kinase [Vibrio vulnificus]EHU4933918.1 thiamine-phosphate kinase [Vibrio vulnificus]
MSGEFNLIEKYFVGRQAQRKDVHLAAGDDCALVKAPANVQIAISTDTLVCGTHFLADADPAWVAHKALASNISDLAAMGATPAWVSFALTMPQADEAWLAPFCYGFFKLADYFGIQLIGGDTTKGPLSLTMTVQGFVPEGKAITRSGAKPGDYVFVTGTLGDAKAGLDVILDSNLRTRPAAQALEKAHYMSMPRILAGQALVGLASAAIDISDGLIADLGHILNRSQVGVSLDVSKLPISSELLSFLTERETALQYALTSGEEYELCFTVPEEARGTIESALAHVGCKVTCIGQIRPYGFFELHDDGTKLNWDLSGFDHFKA